MRGRGARTEERRVTGGTLKPRNGVALDWACGDAHEALRTELPSQPGAGCPVTRRAAG